MFALILMLTSVAQSQEPTGPGIVRFTASPGAEVALFPRPRPDAIELGLYRNRVPIGDQLEGVTARHVVDLDAIAIGGGTTFVTVQVTGPDIQIVPRIDGSDVVLTIAPGPTPKPPIEPTPTLQGILDHLEHRRPARPRPVPLSTLRGAASTALPDPRTLTMEIPPWFPEQAIQGRFEDLLSDQRATWNAIDGHRQVLMSTSVPEYRELAYYRLAKAYLSLGHAREADYYIRGLFEERLNVPQAHVHLLSAQSSAAIGSWDTARGHCVAAARTGASESEALNCLGVVSLGSGLPSPSHVARAIVSKSGDPSDRLLAAWLFQLDHRHDSALPLLEDLPQAVAAEQRPSALLSLGDALFMTGDGKAAQDVWREVPPRHPLRPLSHFREELAKLIETGRSAWAKRIPALRAMADDPGPIGAEALYVLAQISQSQGDVEGAAEYLTQMWRNHRRIALSTDVPERLLLVCRERLSQLNRQNRRVDEAATFGACWRRDLDSLSNDADTLQRVAGVFYDLGLRESGVKVQQRALVVHTATEVEDPDALMALARMYIGTHRYTEALETLEYLRRHTKTSGPDAHLISGDAYVGLDDYRAAERAYRVALAATPDHEEANRRLGLLLADVGRCREAIKRLEGDPDRDARLSRSRCLLDSGDPDAAHAEAMATLAEAGDPWTREQAAWLASVAALGVAEPPEDFPAEDTPVTPLWRKLLEEEQAIRAIEKSIENPLPPAPPAP